MLFLAPLLDRLHSRGSSDLLNRGSSNSGDRGGHGGHAERQEAVVEDLGHELLDRGGGVLDVGGGQVLDLGGGQVLDLGHHGLGKQLGGGRHGGVGDGMGVDLGHCVGVGDSGGSSVGDSRGGGGGHSNLLGHVAGILHGLVNGSSSVLHSVMDGSRGVLHGVLDGSCGVLHHGHNGLADGVNEAVLVQVLGEALEGEGAKALGGLDGISEGGGEGTNGDTLVDMGGGREGAGDKGRQNLGVKI